MEQSVERSFRMLVRKIDLSLPDYMQITHRQADIESLLSRYVSKFSTVVTGAFKRKTLISPLSGNRFLYLVLFDHQRRTDFFPDELQRKLYLTLDHGFDTVRYDRVSHELRLEFDEFTFDVRPGFLLDNSRYQIPANNFRDWIEYDDIGFREVFVKADTKHGGKLKHLVQLLKAWNHENGRLFDEYYLELLVLENSSDLVSWAYPQALNQVFARACRDVVFQKQDPANRSFMVEGLQNIDDLLEAVKTIRKAYSLSDQACRQQQAGDEIGALHCWQQLYPHNFPTVIDMRVDTLRDSGVQGSEALRQLISV